MAIAHTSREPRALAIACPDCVSRIMNEQLLSLHTVDETRIWYEEKEVAEATKTTPALFKFDVYVQYKYSYTNIESYVTPMHGFRTPDLKNMTSLRGNDALQAEIARGIGSDLSSPRERPIHILTRYGSGSLPRGWRQT
jgi:hypothetical protein